jgi:hypothetical protein
MGLSWNFSAEALAIALTRVGESAVVETLAAARSEMEEVRQLAVDFAPEDEGKLEAGIKLREVGGRDALGRFARRRVEVYVDESMPGSGGARNLGQYAYLMHEGLGPYGEGLYRLGKGSVAKDAGRGVVGGKFLERAMQARMNPIARAAREAVEKVIRNA